MKKEKEKGAEFRLNKILVPVDYSDNSIKALEAAIHIAEKMNAGVMVLNIYHMPFADEHMPSEMITELVDAQKEKALDDLKVFKSKHETLFNTGIPVEFETLMGFAAESILEKARIAHADMIILGTQGANSIEDRLFGTVSWNVIKHSDIPVMAIPGGENMLSFKNIMIPFEGTDKDDNMITYLLGFAEQYGATVHAVHFLQDSSNYNKSMIDKLHARFRRELEGDKLQLHFLAEKNITEGIKRFASRNSIDMISMITHNHGLFSTIFHMSVTRKIALYTQIPLLAYNADR